MTSPEANVNPAARCRTVIPYDRRRKRGEALIVQRDENATDDRGGHAFG